MSSINQNRILNILILVSILASIAIPVQATTLKNIPSLEQLKPNKNEIDNKSLNNQLLQVVPNQSKLFSKNSESQNEIESHLLKEVKDTINEVKEANIVRQEDINGKVVYFYNLEATKAVPFSSNTNISGTNQIKWRLSKPQQMRKIPEPSTNIGLIVIIIFFATKCKHSIQKS